MLRRLFVLLLVSVLSILLLGGLAARNATSLWRAFGEYHGASTLTVLVQLFSLLGRPPAPNALAFAATYCKEGSEVGLELEDNSTGLEQINVVYSADRNVLPGLFLSMTSVIRSAANPSSYAFHIVVGQEDQQEAEEVVKCVLREVSDLPALPEVQVHIARPLGFNTSLLSSDWLRRDNRFDRPAVFARLYLHLYLPNASRALYLDTDTVVTTDLGPLYRMKLTHAVAASYEIPALYEECYARYPEIPRGDRSWAFNSGVLLFDLARWRSVVPNVEHALTLTQGCWSDQLALNVGVEGRWDPLPWAWHVKWVGSEWFSALQETCLHKGHIFHWTSGDHSVKPWMPGRNKAMDPLIRPFAPCTSCSIPLGQLPSLCEDDTGREVGRRPTPTAATHQAPTLSSTTGHLDLKQSLNTNFNIVGSLGQSPIYDPHFGSSDFLRLGESSEELVQELLAQKPNGDESRRAARGSSKARNGSGGKDERSNSSDDSNSSRSHSSNSNSSDISSDNTSLSSPHSMSSFWGSELLLVANGSLYEEGGNSNAEAARCTLRPTLQ